MRHPCELGGAYYLFITIMNQLSVFVAAFIYWQYYIPPTAAADILRAVLNATGTNSSASNVSAANLTSASIADIIASTANSTLASSTGAASTAGKIDLITLVASVGALFAVWAFAALGVWRTMKPEYRRTFSSTQTGYAYVHPEQVSRQRGERRQAYRNPQHERAALASDSRPRQAMGACDVCRMAGAETGLVQRCREGADPGRFHPDRGAATRERACTQAAAGRC